MCECSDIICFLIKYYYIKKRQNDFDCRDILPVYYDAQKSFKYISTIEDLNKDLVSVCRFQHNEWHSLAEFINSTCNNVIPESPYEEGRKRIDNTELKRKVITQDFRNVVDSSSKDNKFPRCDTVYSKQLGTYGERLDIIIKITDCKNYSTKIEKYGLGVFMSEPANIIFNTLRVLLKSYIKTKYISTDSLKINITGLSDATTANPYTDKIAVPYGKPKDPNLKDIIDFKYKVTSNRGDTVKKDSVITIFRGDTIRENHRLSAVRAFQVADQLISLNEISFENLFVFSEVGERKYDHTSRGVFIRITFPKAFEHDLEIPGSNKASLDRKKYLWDSKKNN